MDDAALLRYSRQILLPALDLDGQALLRRSTVLLVGLGGLGAPAALYLAGAGCGSLLLADGDEVDLSNLPRQVLYDVADLGKGKAESAVRHLKARNGTVQYEALAALHGNALTTAVTRADLVLDCTDHFASRSAINDACLATGTPWLSAAALRTSGQLMGFDPQDPTSPCYRCLWPEAPAQEEDACAVAGVLGPVVGTLGLLQALEAIKWLSGNPRSCLGQVLSFEGLTLEMSRFTLPRRPHCPACSTAPAGS